MISIEKLQKSVGTRVLFDQVSFNLNEGSRYGLVGANGSGKTTFLRILTGEDPSNAGKIGRPKSARVGFLRQDQFLSDKERIIDCVMLGLPDVYKALKEREIGSETIDPNRWSEIDDLISKYDGYTLEARAGTILEGLGIPAREHAQPLSTLSGGFKLRVLLGQLLLAAPEILLLDEPTNHLDILSIRWLEKYLLNYEGCLVVISHDRRFLDNVCTHILDVDYGTILPYTGNYSNFVEQKKQLREQKEAEIANVKAIVAHKQAFVDRFRAKASKATQAQSRIKQIEKIEIPELAKSSRQSPSFDFGIMRPSGREVLKVKGISKAFGAKSVLRSVSFDVLRHERLSIIGPNGIGKSTLLKILLGEVSADEGSFVWGHETHTGYFAQNHDVLLRERSQKMQDWLWEACPEQGLGFVRSQLGRVLFTKDEAEKSLAVLSGGEIARLCLARLMIEKPNVLILDEPTNHLDVETIDALIEALRGYKGTLIFVSHDRYFVQALATRVLELKPSSVNDFKGTFDEYLAACGDDHLDAAHAMRAKRLEAQSEGANKEKRKESYQENKKKNADVKQRNAELERITKAIETLEKRKAEIEERFCSPGFFENKTPEEIRKLQDEQIAIDAECATLYQRWQTLEAE